MSTILFWWVLAESTPFCMPDWTHRDAICLKPYWLAIRLRFEAWLNSDSNYQNMHRDFMSYMFNMYIGVYVKYIHHIHWICSAYMLNAYSSMYIVYIQCMHWTHSAYTYDIYIHYTFKVHVSVYIEYSRCICWIHSAYTYMLNIISMYIE